MSADALAIAAQGVTKWLTALKPTIVEYKITMVDIEALWQASETAPNDGSSDE